MKIKIKGVTWKIEGEIVCLSLEFKF